jgi:hypothetical protein
MLPCVKIIDVGASSDAHGQDLSLLVDLKYEDLQKLQAVGTKAQAEQAQFILRNDLPKAWQHLKSLKDGRVDIVLDNGWFVSKVAISLTTRSWIRIVH